ncbi:MAG: M48 family metallopeptidase [Cyanobacteriota bacterium]|nr:M48 family metallopeptidase [Cyanobacteriota bacterium]
MFQHLQKLLHYLSRRWVHVVLSVTVLLTIVGTSWQTTHAISLEDLIFNGIRIYEIFDISDEEEMAFGKEIDTRLKSENQIRVYADGSIEDYIDEIGRRLVRVSDRPDLRYTFQVVEDEGINAFATMGGYVYINTGLIRAADNEAQLASVVAHEIAHITERHAVDNLQQAAIAQGIVDVAGIDSNFIVQLGYELAIDRPRSRSAENEADAAGLEFLMDAGYAPIGMVDFFEKLGGGGLNIEFLSTHPDTNERIRNILSRIDFKTASEGDGLDSAAYEQNIRSIL